MKKMVKRKKRLTQNEKNLICRYLIWCYKTTKEELDKVDRYFTQLEADRFILQQLYSQTDMKSKNADQNYIKSINQFQAYMKKKHGNVLKRKFKDTKNSRLTSEYFYLRNRFCAIEKAIKHFLGAKELGRICLLYEQEMTQRILNAKEHA